MKKISDNIVIVNMMLIYMILFPVVFCGLSHALEDPWSNLRKQYEKTKIKKVMEKERQDPWKLLRAVYLPFSMSEEKKAAADPETAKKFTRKFNSRLLQYNTIESCRGKLVEIAPAAIVSKNALNGKSYTRLDELIGQRLKEKLSSDREIIELSRENWFEFREARPLSFKGHSQAHSDLMENIVVFIIDVAPEPLFDQIKVTITAKDSKSRPIPGIQGETQLESFEDSPGTILLDTATTSNPLPAELKENPYNSMEQMCYSLASELSSALEQGVKTGSFKAGGALLKEFFRHQY